MRNAPARLTALTVWVMAAACADGIVLDPAERVDVSSYTVDTIPAGGWFDLVVVNWSDADALTVPCGAVIEEEFEPNGSWSVHFDSRTAHCAAGTLELAPSAVATLRLPAPALPGRYRMSMAWRDREDRALVHVAIPFVVKAVSPVVMQIMEAEHAAGDTMMVRFLNLSPQPWEVDLCARARFEHWFGPWGWQDSGASSDPCSEPPFVIPQSGSLLRSVPLWSTLGGGLGGGHRLRLGFRGPVGEIVVGYSGEFRVRH